MSVREAALEDADDIDRVHVQAWQRAYGDFLAPDDLVGARIPQEDRVASWRERIADADVQTWVYDVDGFVAGFASAGDGHLWALYVDPAAQGAGVGTALLAHAEAALRAEGAQAATLSVFSANEHGRRFYESRGWELVGPSEEQGDFVAPHVDYRKPL